MNPLSHRGRDHYSQPSLACVWPCLLQSIGTCSQRFFHHPGADQQCVQFRWPTLASSFRDRDSSYAPALPFGVRNTTEIASRCASTASTLQAEKQQITGKSLLTSLLLSHHPYPIIALHMVFASTSKRNASPVQPSK